MSADVADRLASVRARIEAAAARSGRSPEEITLVGVSKRIPVADVVKAVRAGLHSIAENYVQEATVKLPELRAALGAAGLEAPRTHFIGQLQRNKARHVVQHFDVVETVDRAKLGEELDRRAAAAGRRLRVLLQVNVSGEAQKGGVSPREAPALLEQAAAWRHLQVAGLMTIPAAAADPRTAFARLRELREELRGASGGERLAELSMGMSGDFEVAIEEGATSIRVGTAIFGPRPT